jgi:hypothetical protein
MLAVTFSYPDVDFEHTFNLLRFIHGTRYNSSRPVKAIVYGTTEGMEACDIPIVVEKIVKTCLCLLHPVKGIMEIPSDIAKCLGIEESELITITNTKVNEQVGC